MARNPEKRQEKIRRGHAEDNTPADGPRKPPEKEMQDLMTRVDPNCEGEYWEEEEEAEKIEHGGNTHKSGK